MKDLLAITSKNYEQLDLTPFDEPVEFKLEKWTAGGFIAKCRIRINYRWETLCEYLESNRIFGHKGELSEDQIKKELITAIADIQEKRLWVFKANHGLLDREKDGIAGIIRFKK
jgi:hypothetical protein